MGGECNIHVTEVINIYMEFPSEDHTRKIIWNKLWWMEEKY